MKYKDKRGAPFCNYFDVNCREGLLLKMLYVFRGMENIFLLYIKRAIMSDTNCRDWIDKPSISFKWV